MPGTQAPVTAACLIDAPNEPAPMTRITFYILQGSYQQGLQTLCRITEKASAQGHSIFIHAPDQNLAQQMDILLWTWNEQSFIAHDLAEQADEASAVVIGKSPPEHLDGVLINLDPEVPPVFSRFSRVVEIVAGDEAQKAAARERFRFYKDRGYPLETHEL